MPLPLVYPLFVHLQASRSAAAALTVVHALAGAALVEIHIPLLLKFLLLLFLSLSLIKSLRMYSLRSEANAVVALKLGRDGEFDLTLRDGRHVHARLDGSSIVLRWMIALRLRDERKLQSLLLLPDMLNPVAWRHLSVLLRAAKTAS